MDGDTSTYEAGIGSDMSNLMADDKGAYANRTILSRLKDGKTSGEKGRTKWSSDELKLTIGSSRFDWKVTSEEGSDITTVLVTVTDTFDFSEGEGERSPIAEWATEKARTAELSNFDVIVEYELKIPME